MYLEVVRNPGFNSREKRSLARPLKRWHPTVTGHVPRCSWHTSDCYWILGFSFFRKYEYNVLMTRDIWVASHQHRKDLLSYPRIAHQLKIVVCSVPQLFIAMLVSTCHCILARARRIQFTLTFYSRLILSFHPCQDLFPSRFVTQILYTFLIPAMSCCYAPASSDQPNMFCEQHQS